MPQFSGATLVSSTYVDDHGVIKTINKYVDSNGNEHLEEDFVLPAYTGEEPVAPTTKRPVPTQRPAAVATTTRTPAVRPTTARPVQTRPNAIPTDKTKGKEGGYNTGAYIPDNSGAYIPDSRGQYTGN